MRGRWGAAALLAAAAATYVVGLADHELWTPDEPRVAEIAREIGRFHGPAVPTLNGQPFLEKPPLYFWSAWLAYRIAGGATAALARLPSALYALGTAGWALLLARRLFGRGAGLAAFFLTAFSLEMFFIGHRAIADPALAFAVAGAVWALHLGFYPRSPREARWGWAGFYGFCALGFYAKGLIGIAFPGLAFLGLVVAERRFGELAKPRHILGGMFLLAGMGAWLLALRHEDPSGGFLREFVVHNHLQRFIPSTGYVGGHKRGSPFYYLINFPHHFLPGTVFLAHAAAFHRRRRTPREKIAIVLAWFGLGFLLLTLAGTKRQLYLLPLTAPAAIFVAPWLAALSAGEGCARGTRAVLWIGAGILAGIACLFPAGRLLYDGRFSVPIAAACAGSSWIAWGTFRSLRRREWARLAPFSALLLLAAYAAGAGSWVGFLDRYKSMRPFGEAIARLVPAEAPLVLYKPDETTRGIVPFYTGRYPGVVIGAEDLQRRLADRDRLYVVFLEKYSRGGRSRLPRAGQVAPLEAFLLATPERERAGKASPRLRILASNLSGARRRLVLTVEVPGGAS